MRRCRGDRLLHLPQCLVAFAVEPAPFGKRREWSVRIERLARDLRQRFARRCVTTGRAQRLWQQVTRLEERPGHRACGREVLRGGDAVAKREQHLALQQICEPFVESARVLGDQPLRLDERAMATAAASSTAASAERAEAIAAAIAPSRS